jgi:ubiquinone/menaquinone biosynthesis C-methylase UbiE
MKTPGTPKKIHRKNSSEKVQEHFKNNSVAQKSGTQKNPSDKKAQTKKSLTSWGGVSEWYGDVVADSDSYQVRVIEPNLTRLLGDVTKTKILDLACGEGFFARSLRARGADVIGCDVAPELVELAKQKDKTGVYVVAESHSLSKYADKTFDTIICILALQNIEKLKETCHEASRLLKFGGRFVFVLNHPSFRNPKHSDWYYSDELKIQGRVSYEYMSEKKTKIDMTPGERDTNKKKYTYSFHRPLQTYIKLLSKAGFSIVGLEEWVSHKKSEKGPRAAAEDKARHEIPMFLSIECTKIASTGDATGLFLDRCEE